MNEMIEGLQAISDFFTSGLFEFFDALFVELSTWFVVWAMKAKIMFMKLSWGVAENLIANLSISSMIESSWSSMDSGVLGYVTFFRIPEAINILIQAVVARFAFGVLT